MRISGDNLISRQEAAAILGCHINTIGNYLRTGLLTRYVHPNGKWVYLDKTEVEQLLTPQAQ